MAPGREGARNAKARVHPAQLLPTVTVTTTQCLDCVTSRLRDVIGAKVTPLNDDQCACTPFPLRSPRS